MQKIQPKPADSARPFDLFTTREAAQILKTVTGTLENWRSQGIGPKYIRLGSRAIRYSRADLEAFIHRCSTRH